MVKQNYEEKPKGLLVTALHLFPGKKEKRNRDLVLAIMCPTDDKAELCEIFSRFRTRIISKNAYRQ